MSNGEAPNSNFNPTSRKKIWLILGVSIFAIVIFMLWVWSEKIQLNNLNWLSGGEKRILDNLKGDWQTTGEVKNNLETQKQLAEEAAKIKLKEILEKAAGALNSASTTNKSASSSPVATSTKK